MPTFIGEGEEPREREGLDTLKRVLGYLKCKWIKCSNQKT